MALRISFELSQKDLDYFCDVMLRVSKNNRGIPQQKVIDSAKQLLTKIHTSDTSDFVRDRMSQLETLVDMLVDEAWGMIDEDRKRVLSALSYFAEPEDLIPDDTPGLGFIDDAIMVEIVCLALKHEIQAYKEFDAYRSNESSRLGDKAPTLQKSDWLEERRQQLHSRMRRRRKNDSGARKTKSPFSLL